MGEVGRVREEGEKEGQRDGWNRGREKEINVRIRMGKAMIGSRKRNGGRGA